MKFDVRARMVAWLVLVLVPIAIAGWVAVDLAGDRIDERVAVDLANIRRLEAARVGDVLDGYGREAESLASGPHVMAFTAGVVAARAEPGEPADVIGGVDGFAVIDAFAERPLDELVVAMQRKAGSSGSDALAVRIVGPDEEILGTTSNFGWQPYDETLIGRVIESGRTQFGNAFRAADGDERVGVATPIFDAAGDVVGATVIELRLAPITDLLLEHEEAGETTEAHIAQPDRDGNAEFISLLRFERDSAFEKVVPREKGLPINQALESPGGRVVRAGDYRQVESILAIETIEQTGWGLVVKIDADEADQPIEQLRELLLFTGVGLAAVVILGWALLLRPLGHRLQRTARAARRVADGEYESRIDDHRSDEIGEMARGIDRLAADLAEDIAIRSAAEQQLWRQASHDDLTGLLNRKRLAEMLDEFDADGGTDLSILFVDLDGFKTVNDTFGHQVGDDVLVAVAGLLRDAAGDGLVARWGGDEFVVALRGSPAADADAVAVRIEQLLEDPIETSVGRHIVRASIGRSDARPGSRSLDVLYEADAAMFREKQAGRGMRVVSSRTLRAVEVALAEDRIEVWYQPIVTTAGGADPIVCGAEALVRMRSLDGSLASPAEYLPAIQDMYLGSMLDRRVIALSFAHLATWIAERSVPDEFRLSVNLSGASTRDAGLVDFMVAEATDVGIDLRRIVVEISEETRSIDPGLIQELGAVGVSIAVDDVGLTHSNVDRLVDVNAQIAKIDRRWLRDAGASNGDRTVTAMTAIVGLCRDLGMLVVGEGVELAAQVELLGDAGVEHFQGFYFAEPAPPGSFAADWLGRGTSADDDPAHGASVPVDTAQVAVVLDK
ncbi:MAG: EAL domain-containing protein [Ilumatobacter sp.]|uniref:EAL domain-containing protein n=1 Tax=Ilumatobacter sp. TaxID=1967498 RepID=UPI0026215448|nr:EAL domain-containing protein [Ilumatobacter sp.]MDJ0768099.1 EAL domain-containing protein [Ilumatobacter sp.]